MLLVLTTFAHIRSLSIRALTPARARLGSPF